MSTAAAAMTTTTTTSSSRRVAISRRVWQAHKATLPKTSRPKPKSADDKPWPKSVQMAGYAAGAIFVPYSCIWLMTSSPSLRPWLGSYLELFRRNFGEEEWDAKSYVEREEELEDGYFQFPGEWSYNERTLDKAAEARDLENITANLYVLGGDQLVHQTKQVPASTRANRQVLSEVLESSNAAVAVDFESSANDSESCSESFIMADQPDSTTVSKTKPLLQQTHTFSKWYYLHRAEQQSSESKMTDVQVEESRLEYSIAELEKQLKDPNGTRDIDNMTSELRQAKRDLSKLKWKRRLGL